MQQGLNSGPQGVFFSKFLQRRGAEFFIGNIWQDIFPFLMDKITKLLPNVETVLFYIG